MPNTDPRVLTEGPAIGVSPFAKTSPDDQWHRLNSIRLKVQKLVEYFQLGDYLEASRMQNQFALSPIAKVAIEAERELVALQHEGMKKIVEPEGANVMQAKDLLGRDQHPVVTVKADGRAEAACELCHNIRPLSEVLAFNIPGPPRRKVCPDCAACIDQPDLQKVHHEQADRVREALGVSREQHPEKG